MKASLFDVSGIIRRETEYAILLDHGGKKACWLPKSKIEIERGADSLVVVTMPQWLAENEGIV
jgi:hypothetical protein